MTQPVQVLIVEDEAPIRQWLRTSLEAEGYRVHEAADAREGETLAGNRRVDLFLVDLGLPDLDGLQFIRRRSLFFLLFVLGEGTVLLWLAVFSAKQRGFVFYLVVVLLLVFLPIRMAVLGSRSSLILGLMPIAFAFTSSGRKLKLRVAVIFGVIGLLAVVIGATYGTTFRNIKGSESRISAGDYFGQVVATVDYLTTEDLGVVV